LHADNDNQRAKQKIASSPKSNPKKPVYIQKEDSIEIITAGLEKDKNFVNIGID
jgi:hypothetical protein